MQAPSQDHGTSVPLLDPSHELPAQASPDSDGTGRGKKSPWRMILILLLVTAAVVFVVWRIRGNKSDEKKEGARSAQFADRPVPVSVERAQLRQVPVYLTALGTVTAYNTVSLRSRVDGQIIAVNFTEGQHVRVGQSLIKIDPAPYQAVLAQAKGNLARDEANAKLASTQANRYDALYQAGVVSRETAQQQQSTAGQASGTIEADRAAIKAAQVNLNYTSITSPISGIVGLRQVDIGNIVTANSTNPLVVITQVQPISVIFTLPEDQLPQVFAHTRNGGKLDVEAWDRNNTVKIATGKLLTVDNQIDPATGTAKLKAVFPNTDEALYPNQFVNIRLVLETRNNALTVPMAAVQQANNGSNFVYVVDTSKAAPAEGCPGAEKPAGGKKSGDDASAASAPAAGGQGGGGRKGGSGGGGNSGPKQTAYCVAVKPVVVDLTQGSVDVLKSGIKAGDVIVTDGQEKLKNGSKVVLSRGGSQNAQAGGAQASQGNGQGQDTEGGPGKSGDRGAMGGQNSGGGRSAHNPQEGATPQSPGGRPKSMERDANGGAHNAPQGANKQ